MGAQLTFGHAGKLDETIKSWVPKLRNLIHRLIDAEDQIAAIEPIKLYSEEEVNTKQVWIDGKEIYRKVIDIGTLPNATIKNTGHGIASFSNLVRIYGIANNGSTYLTIPHVSSSAAANQINMQVTTANVRISTAIDFSAYSGHVILEYTK
jgi:hypothetical protein